MSINKTIKDRRSIRKYKPDTIPKNIIKDLKEALIWAPSAGNLQSRKFYFVYNKETREKLAQAAYGQTFIAEAPLVIVGCTDSETAASEYGQRGSQLYTICDVSLSIQNAMLLATEHKLGTCWVGSFDEGVVGQTLSIPKNLRPIVILPVGYPDEEPSPPERIEDATVDIV